MRWRTRSSSTCGPEFGVDGIDAVLHTGDIAEAVDTATYKIAHELIDRLDAPALVTPGNHDDPVLVAAEFGDAAAIEVQHLDIGDWRLVLVSSWHEGRPSGTFTNETLDALVRTLDVDRPVLVGTHHPPLSPCSHNTCLNDRSVEFLELIDAHKNVGAVISGHLHLEDALERRGVSYLLSPSTAMQLRHIHPVAENNTSGTLGGARIIDLDADGSVASHVVWV